MEQRRSQSWFSRFARGSARAAGRPAAFLTAVLVVAIWAALGPSFHYSDTWQLVINTATTIITFLMVFLIQSTQNRDAEAAQAKLNELLRALEGAHTGMIGIEELDDGQLESLRNRYERLAERARARLKHGRSDTGTPKIVGVVVDEAQGSSEHGDKK